MRMTRLLQAMAGRRMAAPRRSSSGSRSRSRAPGEKQRLVIRRDAARAARLRAPGCDVVELPFGGRSISRTRPVLRRVDRRIPRRDVVLTWMSRATQACPRGDFVHVARLGGYYDLKYYSSCDHLIANTRDIADYIVRGGWPADRVHYLPNFAATAAAAPAAAREPRHARGRAARAGARPASSQQGLRRAARGGGARAAPPSLARRRGATSRHALERAGGAARHRRPRALPRLARGRARRCWPRRHAGLSVAHEPLGNVVIEAWAAGVPVVATASEGPRELIRDGETGLLVPIDDADALAARDDARSPATAPLRARLAAAGRAAYEAEFSRGARGRALSRVLGDGAALMCGIAGMMTLNGEAPPAARVAGDGGGAAPSRARRQRPLPLGRCRHGADAARHHRSRHRRPAALRAGRRRAGRQWRDLQLSRARPRSAGRQASRRSPIASCRCISIAATGSTSRGICAACTRIALHDPGGRAAGAGARSLRHQAALLRRDGARLRLRLGAAGAHRWRPRRGRAGAPGAQRAAAAAVHHRRATRSSPASSACCRARPWSSPRAASSSAAASRRSTPRRPRCTERGAGARRARPRASPTASMCISAPTCLTACSCRAASIPRRCWR